MHPFLVVHGFDEFWYPGFYICIGFVIGQVHLLSFQCFEPRLHERVVIAVALGGHTWNQLVVAETLDVFLARVLDPTI